MSPAPARVAPWDPRPLFHSPLLEALRPAAAALRVSGDWPDCEWLNFLDAPGRIWPSTALGHPIRFVRASGDPAAPAYEPGILETGAVPTRACNWHDLLNALVWLSYPLTKAALNAVHCEARRARAPNTDRGAVEDALTGFDESGVAVACADPELAALLRGFRWKELFWARRDAVRRRMGFFLFGHGLCEQAFAPFIGLTGKGIVIEVAESFFAQSPAQQLGELDRALAAIVADGQALRSPRELAPVPLLGVPGWWPDNEAESFYENTDHFRPGRMPRRTAVSRR